MCIWRIREVRMRYWYPYCGYKLGFCKAKDGCKRETVKGRMLCPFLRRLHPLSKQAPVMVSGSC